MRLRDFYNMLKDVELKQIVVKNQDDQIYTMMNMALIDVYSALDILQEEQVIVLEENVTRYRLLDKCVRVLEAYRKFTKNDSPCFEDSRLYPGSCEIPINDENNELSIFTPQPYILHVPNPREGDILSLIESVEPPYVTNSNIDILEFMIPPALMEPLLSYVGYRAYLSKNGYGQEAMAYYQRYMNSINTIKQRGLTHRGIMTNLKLSNRGFR